MENNWKWKPSFSQKILCEYPCGFKGKQSTKTINTKRFDFEVELTFIFPDVNKMGKHQEKTSSSAFSPYQMLFTRWHFTKQTFFPPLEFPVRESNVWLVFLEIGRTVFPGKLDDLKWAQLLETDISSSKSFGSVWICNTCKSSRAQISRGVKAKGYMVREKSHL